MAKKVFKRVSRKMNFFKFTNKGDILEGKIVGIRETETKHGEASVADLITEDGKEISIIISAGLGGLEKLIGKTVQIEYCGMEVNPATRQAYKNFEIAVAEDELGDLDKSFIIGENQPF